MEFNVNKDTTLLPFLREVMPDKSRTSVKSFLTHGQVSINGCSTTRFDAPLQKGDTVSIASGRQTSKLRHPLLRIVYEDEYLIVADKYNGLLSVGTDKEQRKTAFFILSEHIKKENPSARLFVVHRLDRETSGLLIYAKDQSTQETLQKSWKEAVLDRRYVAVVEGAPTPRNGSVSTFLREDRNLKMWACATGEGTKAVTDYRVIKEGSQHSLVELSLETGKKNQIRAHMEWLKTPIAGDRKYGATTNPAGRVCLHAFRLRFRHPATGEILDFSTGIPRIFEEAVNNSGLPTVNFPIRGSAAIRRKQTEGNRR